MTPARQTGPPAAPPTGLATQLQYLKGVGPQRGKLLAKKDLTTVEDALFFIPLRHEDRTRLTALGAIQPGQVVTCAGTIAGISPPPPGRARAPLVLLLRDATGYGTATLFGRGFLTRVLQRGQKLILHGRGARYRDKVTLQVQDWEMVESGDDEPIHAGRAGARLLDDRGIAPAGAAVAHVAPGGGVRRGRPRDAARGAAAPAQRDRAARGPSRRPLSVQSGRGGGRPPPAGLRGLPLAAARSGHPALPHDPRARHRHESARAAREWAPRRVAMEADRGAGARVGRDPRGHGGAPPDAPPAAGRRGLGQDDRRCHGRAHRDRGGLPGRGDGAHRDPGRAAPHDVPASARAARRAGDAADLLAQGPRADGPARRRGGRRGGLRGRHARAGPGARGVQAPGLRRGGRAAPLRRRAARAAQGQGRASRRAGHDRHADPAHAGAHALRRPRRVGARRAAARTQADRHGGPHREPAAADLRLPARAGRPAAARSTWSIPSSRNPS